MSLIDNISITGSPSRQTAFDWTHHPHLYLPQSTPPPVRRMTTGAVHLRARCPELITLNTNVLRSAENRKTNTYETEKYSRVHQVKRISHIYRRFSECIYRGKKKRNITKVLSTCWLSRRSGVQLPMSVHVQIVSGYRWVKSHRRTLAAAAAAGCIFFRFNFIQTVVAPEYFYRKPKILHPWFCPNMVNKISYFDLTTHLYSIKKIGLRLRCCTGVVVKYITSHAARVKTIKRVQKLSLPQFGQF